MESFHRHRGPQTGGEVKPDEAEKAGVFRSESTRGWAVNSPVFVKFVQQIRGSCSPVSISMERSPPMAVRSRTRPAETPETSPMHAA